MVLNFNITTVYKTNEMSLCLLMQSPLIIKYFSSTKILLFKQKLLYLYIRKYIQKNTTERSDNLEF